jgi:hypothetical protein
MYKHKLSLYHPKDIDKLSDFWLRHDYFKGAGPAALKRHLLWKYDKRFTHLWMVKKQDRIIGSCGRTKTKLLSHGRAVCNGPWGLDSLVERCLDPKERRCVFLRVYRGSTFEGYRKKEPEIGFCFPNQVVRKTYLRTVWLDIPIFFKYSKSVTPGYLKSQDIASELKFSLIKSFDSRWDRLWRRFSASFSLVVLRDHSYLNWRYFKNPDRKYIVFLISIRNEIKGYLVVREQESFGKKVGHIVDFLMEPQNKKLDNIFINKAIAFLALRGCSSVDAHVSHKRYKDIFLDLGFKEEKVDLFMFLPFPKLLKKFSRNKNQWFITSGDGDFEMES